MLDDFGSRSWDGGWQLRQSLTKNRIAPENSQPCGGSQVSPNGAVYGIFLNDLN
jgi:hypothetical protein